MEDPTIPSSLIGAIVFFLLIGILLYAVVRETLKIVLKPALVVIALVLLATWMGILDETVVGDWFETMGERLLAGLSGVAEWAADAWESRQDV